MNKNVCHQKLFKLMVICVMICGIFLPVFSFSQSMPKKQSILKPHKIRTVILKPGFEKRLMKKRLKSQAFQELFFCLVSLFMDIARMNQDQLKKIFDFVKKFTLIFRSLQVERISWPFFNYFLQIL